MCRPSQTPHLTMSSAQISCQTRLIRTANWGVAVSFWAPQYRCRVASNQISFCGTSTHLQKLGRWDVSPFSVSIKGLWTSRAPRCSTRARSAVGVCSCFNCGLTSAFGQLWANYSSIFPYIPKQPDLRLTFLYPSTLRSTPPPVCRMSLVTACPCHPQFHEDISVLLRAGWAGWPSSSSETSLFLRGAVWRLRVRRASTASTSWKERIVPSHGIRHHGHHVTCRCAHRGKPTRSGTLRRVGESRGYARPRR